MEQPWIATHHEHIIASHNLQVQDPIYTVVGMEQHLTEQQEQQPYVLVPALGGCIHHLNSMQELMIAPMQLARVDYLEQVSQHPEDWMTQPQ